MSIGIVHYKHGLVFSQVPRIHAIDRRNVTQEEDLDNSHSSTGRLPSEGMYRLAIPGQLLA